jgi:hypothetical protein
VSAQQAKPGRSTPARLIRPCPSHPSRGTHPGRPPCRPAPRVLGSSNYLLTTEYNALGQWTRQTYGNGKETRRVYRSDNSRLEQIESGGTYGPEEYTYDAVGAIIGSLDTIEAYDAGDRVRIEVHNTANWRSALRIPGTDWSLGRWIPRAFPSGPGSADCVQVFTFYVTKP